ELEGGDQRHAALPHHRGQCAIPRTAVERGRKGVREHVDAALDRDPCPRTIRGMREYELAAAMPGLDGRPHDLERHHDDRARRGKGAGEEFDDVRAARELGLDTSNIFRASELEESGRKNIVWAASGRHEASARA